jgi:hypothetical protein
MVQRSKQSQLQNLLSMLSIITEMEPVTKPPVSTSPPLRTVAQSSWTIIDNWPCNPRQAVELAHTINMVAQTSSSLESSRYYTSMQASFPNASQGKENPGIITPFSKEHANKS